MLDGVTKTLLAMVALGLFVNVATNGWLQSDTQAQGGHSAIFEALNEHHRNMVQICGAPTFEPEEPRARSSEHQMIYERILWHDRYMREACGR